MENGWQKHIYYSILVWESQDRKCGQFLPDGSVHPRSGTFGDAQGGQGTQTGLQDLAGKHSPKITLDPVCRDGKEYKGKAQKQTQDAVQKGESGLAETVQDASKRAREVEKRTDEAEREDETPGKGRVEQQFSGKPPEQQKEQCACKAEEQTVLQRLEDSA